MTSLAGIARLLIDGNNLLHRISGGADEGAQRLLLARLVAAIPPSVDTIVMLDGHAAAGTNRRQRVRRGLDIQHAGSISADDALLYVIRDAPPGARHTLTLVTDDRALTDKARHLGAHTQRLAWLEQLLEGGSGGGTKPPASIGRKGIRPPADQVEQHEREPWQAGRGATRKRGNPRRTPKRPRP